MIRHMSYTEFRKMKPYMSARDLSKIRPLSISPDELWRMTDHDAADKGLLSRLAAATTRTEARKILDVIHWSARKYPYAKALRLLDATTAVLKAPSPIQEQTVRQARLRALKELPDCF